MLRQTEKVLSWLACGWLVMLLHALARPVVSWQLVLHKQRVVSSLKTEVTRADRLTCSLFSACSTMSSIACACTQQGAGKPTPVRLGICGLVTDGLANSTAVALSILS